MKTEYSEAKSKSGEANPLRWSNLFHLTVGIFNLLAGCLVAFLLTREVEAVGLGLLPALGIAATLLVLGLAQVARAWRDEKFRFRPDDIGSFAVPGKHIHGGNSNESAHLVDVLSNGVQPSDTPDNALLNKLYNSLPKLELAPEVIRWHAETQVLRMAKLLVATLGFTLAWLFATSEVFIWMAPFYLLLVVSPIGALKSIARGKAGDEQLARPAAPTPYGAVAIVLCSIFVPVLANLAPEGALPVAPYGLSTIVVPTVVAIAVLLAASLFFILSLKAQTRDLATSGVSQAARDDLNVPNLSSGLIDRLETSLPLPRRVLSRNPGWQKDGDFGGSLLVETEERLNARASQGTVLEALRAAWGDREQRPLLALGGLGALTGLLATTLLFVFTRGGSVSVGLTALSLFSASQFSLMASRGLWNRVDFTSVVYRIIYKGSYSKAQRVAGSIVGSGTLTEEALRIEHVDFWVCVAQVGSVAFSRKGLRYIQSVDLKPDACEQQFARIEHFYQSVKQRHLKSYQEERAVRQLVQGQDAPSGSGIPLVRVAHDSDEVDPVAVVATQPQQ